MDIDESKVEEQDDEEVPAPATPDRSDDETDAEVEAPVPLRREKSSETARSSSVAQAARSDVTESKGAPPLRSLPFGRPATRSKDVAEKLAPSMDLEDDEDGDETEDEEL